MSGGGNGYRRLCAVSGSASDRHFSAKLTYPFPDALKTEMPLLNARTFFGVETATVIFNGEKELVAIDAACDFHRFCMSMADGVLDEFSYDSEKGMGCVF